MANVQEEEIESLPLPSGADDSRNDLSELGLLLLANQTRLRKDLQPLSPSEGNRTAFERDENDIEMEKTEYMLDPFEKQAPQNTIYYHEEDIGKANKEHLTDSSESDEHRGFFNNAATNSLHHSTGASRRSKSNVFGAIGANQDEDDLFVPETGIFADQCVPTGADFDTGSTFGKATQSIDRLADAGNSRIDRSLGPAGLPVDYSQTKSAMHSAATLGSFGELNRRAMSPVMAKPTPSVSRERDLSESFSRSVSHSTSRSKNHPYNDKKDVHRSKRASASGSHDVSASDRSRHDRRNSQSISKKSGDSFDDENQQQQQHRRHRRHRKSRHNNRHHSAEKREQTYEEFQDSIRSKVKQQEDMEKREMLLLFYQKQRYEGAEVPKKFFEQGLNSDLYEMRWWYYKLIRDTRINDEVASMKHKIVQGSRFALFLNNTIGNPLNLRLDNNFPKELANTLNTSTDRHLREHIKSKCGVSGPKPRPWSHILRDIWECGWNYHQNNLSLEEAEKRRKNQQQQQQAPQQQVPQLQQQLQQQPVPTNAPAFDAYTSMLNEQQRSRQFASTQPTNLHAAQGTDWQQHYQRLLQHQALQRQMLEQQRPQAVPPAFQPNRAPLRDVFRNMSAEMRREPIPEHLRPPKMTTAVIEPAALLAPLTNNNLPTAENVNSQMSLGEAAARFSSRPTTELAPKVQFQQPAEPVASNPAVFRPPQSRLQSLPSIGQKKSPINRQLSASGPPGPPGPLVSSRPSVPPTVSSRPSVPPMPATRLTGPRYTRANIPSFNVSKTSALRNLPRPANVLESSYGIPSLVPKSQLPPRSSSTEPYLNVRTFSVDEIMSQPVYQVPSAPKTPLQQKPIQRNVPATTKSAVQSTKENRNVFTMPNIEVKEPKKRSMQELMQELQKVHDEEINSDEDDDCMAQDGGFIPEMPEMPTDDKFASALSMMEQFNGDEEQNNEAKSRAALYDIEDVLDLNTSVSLSEIQPKKQDTRSSNKSRSRRRRNNNDNSTQSSQAKEPKEPKEPKVVEERAITPPPQLAALTEGKSSVGRSGRTKFQF